MDREFPTPNGAFFYDCSSFNATKHNSLYGERSPARTSIGFDGRDPRQALRAAPDTF